MSPAVAVLLAILVVTLLAACLGLVLFAERARLMTLHFLCRDMRWSDLLCPLADLATFPADYAAGIDALCAVGDDPPPGASDVQLHLSKSTGGAHGFVLVDAAVPTGKRARGWLAYNDQAQLVDVAAKVRSLLAEAAAPRLSRDKVLAMCDKHVDVAVKKLRTDDEPMWPAGYKAGVEAVKAAVVLGWCDESEPVPPKEETSNEADA